MNVFDTAARMYGATHTVTEINAIRAASHAALARLDGIIASNLAASMAEGTLVVSGGAALAGGLLVGGISMAAVFTAIGLPYVQARKLVTEEKAASGFSRGLIMGLLGWEWQHARDRFAINEVVRTNKVDATLDVYGANAYNLGLKSGFAAGGSLPKGKRDEALAKIRAFAGPQNKGNWTQVEQKAYVVNLAAAARKHGLVKS